MKLKISCFNKGVLRNDIKSFGWIGICYLLFLLFEVPFKILMINSNNAAHSTAFQDIFLYNNVLMLSIAVIPVLTAILLFRYIQSKKSVDMIHCLPIKRVKLYDNHIFIGILILVVPVLITALSALLLKGALNLNTTDFTVKTIASWTGRTILFNIVIFLSSVLIGMFTGLSSAQGILTYIFLFLPRGLTPLINYNLNFFVYGFTNDLYSVRHSVLATVSSPLEKYYFSNSIPFYSPIERYLAHTPMTSMEIFKYIIFCIVFYLVARFAYHKRSLEVASNAVPFKHLQPVFKYGLTFCCMLLGGIYFGGIYFNGPKYRFYWVIFGYAIASLIGYIIAEIAITKSLRIFRHIKGYFIYVIIIVLVLIGINSDIIGYEKRIPSLTNIESIYLDGAFYTISENDQRGVYSEKETFNTIVKLHQKLITNKKFFKYSSDSHKQVAILYNLKNGKQIKRQYNVSPQEYDEYLKPVYESKEYKKMYNVILNIDYNSSIDKISINPIFANKNVTITNPKEIKEAIEILKNDVLNETYKDIMAEDDVWANIIISSSDVKKIQRIDLSWKKSYKGFENWLKQKGYYTKARTMPEDVDYALIEKRTDTPFENNNVKRLKIMDKSKLEICLTNFSNNSDGQYVLYLHMKNGANPRYLNFEDEDVPDFVKEYFK
jgi:ABC-2 type transport system permease protein